MKCKECGKEYDLNLHENCPFCFVDDNLKDKIVLEENQDIDLKIMIADAFPGRKYLLFSNFCTSLGYIYLEDLLSFDFLTLNTIPGLGVKKREDIYTRYNALLSNQGLTLTKSSIVEMPLFMNMHSDFQALPIDSLIAYGLKNRTIELLVESNITTLGCLLKQDNSTLKNIVGTKNMDKLKNVALKMEQNLVSNLQLFLEETSNNVEFNVVLKKARGETFEAIGSELGVTRERARQIIRKYCKTLSYLYDYIIKDMLGDMNYISEDKVFDLCDNDSFDEILFYYLSIKDDYEYLDCANVFVNSTSVEEELVAIAKDFIAEGISLKESSQDIEILMQTNGYPFMDIPAFIHLAMHEGYKLYGDYLTPIVSYGQLSARIVAKNFPNGVKLYGGEDLEILRKLIKEEYGDIEVASDDRSFSIRLSDYLILRGRGEFIAEENVYIELSLLESIVQYINECPESNIYYSSVYECFEEELRLKSNVDNYYFLHGVLKQYFLEEYDFSARDYLIKKDGNSTYLNLGEKIRRIINEEQRPIHQNEIKKKCPGISDIMLFNAISNEPDLTKWEHSYYMSTNLVHFSKQEEDIMNELMIKLSLEYHGVFSDGLLYDLVEKHIEPTSLQKNHIKNQTNLHYFCATQFVDTYDFRRPHIAKKGILEELTIKSIALYLLDYPKTLEYSNYRNLCDKMKWSSSTSLMMFSEIEANFIRISANNYIHKDTFTIQETHIEEIDNVISSIMEDGIVPIYTFSNWKSLPVIDYEWTTYLLKQIIDRYSYKYKVIDTKTNNRKQEKGIIVSKDDDVNNYIAIVIRYLKNLDISIIHESDLLSILIKRGLAIKVIPKEVSMSNELNYVNGYYTLK